MPAFPTKPIIKRRLENTVIFDAKSEKEPLGQTTEVIVDEADWPVVCDLNWREDRNGYIIAKTRKEPRKTVLLHRFILGETARGVDHINTLKWDNRRENLRIATHSQNHGNKNPKAGKTYKGAYLQKATGRYYSAIMCQGKKYSLGSYATEEEAARAYDEGARRLFGEFARLNFP